MTAKEGSRHKKIAVYSLNLIPDFAPCCHLSQLPHRLVVGLRCCCCHHLGCFGCPSSSQVSADLEQYRIRAGWDFEEAGVRHNSKSHFRSRGRVAGSRHQGWARRIWRHSQVRGF